MRHEKITGAAQTRRPCQHIQPAGTKMIETKRQRTQTHEMMVVTASEMTAPMTRMVAGFVRQKNLSPVRALNSVRKSLTATCSHDQLENMVVGMQQRDPRTGDASAGKKILAAVDAERQ